MNKKLFLTTLLLSSSALFACGQTKDDKENHENVVPPEPVYKTEKMDFDFGLETPHMTIGSYAENEQHLTTFKNSFINNHEIIDTQKPVKVENIFGANGKYPDKAVNAIKFGSQNHNGLLSFSFNDNLVKQITGIKVEVYNYLLGSYDVEAGKLTYTNESSKICLYGDSYKAIPASTAQSFTELTPVEVEWNEEECSKFNNDFSIKNVRTDAAFGRFFLKSITFNYIVA